MPDHLTPKHGFTSVDEQTDPGAWIAVLDRIRREPFYTAYKQRVLDLLGPRVGGRYLDIGAGTGDDARSISTRAENVAVALDRSFTMASECRSRGGVHALVADASSLPFPDKTFDGCTADRTFQHLSEPELALDEIFRVTKSGARVVVVDPDYDTQVMEFPDQELARRVLRYRADQMLANGTIAHRTPAMFSRVGLNAISVDSMTLVVRDSAAVDNVMGLRTWARTASTHGHLSAGSAERWERLFDETIAAKRFLYSVTFFITSATKP